MNYKIFSKEFYKVLFEANKLSKGNLIEPKHILLGILRTKNLVSIILDTYKFQHKETYMYGYKGMFKFSESSLKLISDLLLKNQILTTVDFFKELLKSNDISIKYYLKYINIDKLKLYDIFFTKSNFTYLNHIFYNINLNFDIIGRELEIVNIIYILNRNIKNNVVIVGEPGVGRFSLLKGVLSRIKDNWSDKNNMNANKEFYVLDLTKMSILGGNDSLQKLHDWIINNPDIILVIPDLENNYSPELYTPILNIIFSLVKQNKLQIIITTDLNKFSSSIESNIIFLNLYEKIHIKEPTKPNIFNILNNKKFYLENFYSIKISKSVINSIIQYSDTHNKKPSPSKELELLDTICSKFCMNYTKNTYITQYYFNKIVDKNANTKQKTCINYTLIKDLKFLLNKRIFGQQLVVDKITNSIKKSLLGFKSHNKPIGSWLLCGPSGTGKTELAKGITEVLFGDENKMVRFDMSEFMEKHSVAKLIGSPPGYVGYGEQGLLTRSVNNTPNCLLLFDEIEKSHPEILNIMLQILDDGRLTDSTGKTTNFSNTIIIFTSNLGCPKQTHEFNKLVDNNTIIYEIQEDKILDSIKQYFKPEILNRIQDTLIFQPLRFNDMLLILDKFINQFIYQIKTSRFNIKVKIHNNLKHYIVNLSISPIYGARPMKRIFDELIVEPTIDILIKTKIQQPHILYYTLDNNKNILYNLRKI